MPVIRLFIAMLTLLLPLVVAAPAEACNYINPPPVEVICRGSNCPSEGERIRAVRAEAYQQWLTDRAHLRQIAREGLADPSRNYAQDLARALVPPAIVTGLSICGSRPSEYDSAGYLQDYEEAQHWLWSRAQAYAGGQRWPNLMAENIPAPSVRILQFAELGDGCNIEFRARVAAGLPHRLPADALRASWAAMMRAGEITLYAGTGLSQPPRLVRFANGDRTGSLVLDDGSFASGWFSSHNADRERGVRRDAWRYLQNNPDGQALLSALNAAIADARGDGSEGALCPQTWQTAMAGLVEALDEAERHDAERRRTPRPRPATAPAQPSTPAG